MVALQAPAYRVGNSMEEVAHAVEAEAVQVDEDAPVSRVEMTVQLVEHGGLSRAPLPVEYDRRVAVQAGQVTLDERKDILTAVEHLGAGDRAPCDVGVHARLRIHGRLA